MKNNIFRLEIKQANDNKIVFPEAKVFLNLNLENTWKPLVADSLVADENLLLKIQDIKEHKTYYLLLEDTNVFVANKTIKMISLATLNMYQSDKNNFIANAEKMELLDIREKLYLYKLRQEVGLDLQEMIEIRKLKKDLFVQKAIKTFNLVKMEKLDAKDIY